MEIGNVIKERRVLKGMTQEELAQALSVTPQAVSRWEIGISYPDIAMVPEIVRVLGVSADSLLGCGDFDKKEKPPAAPSATVQDKDRVLNQSQVDSIFDYVPPLKMEQTCIRNNEGEKTVLVVYDSDFMRMMLTDILSKNGHRILQYKSGEECLDRLKDKTGDINADVCILDIKMPGMNGLEVLERIKKDYSDVKVIMLSALCTEEVVKKALELGADGFVAKPFQSDSILERI